MFDSGEYLSVPDYVLFSIRCGVWICIFYLTIGLSGSVKMSVFTFCLHRRFKMLIVLCPTRFPQVPCSFRKHPEHSSANLPLLTTTTPHFSHPRPGFGIGFGGCSIMSLWQTGHIMYCEELLVTSLVHVSVGQRK